MIFFFFSPFVPKQESARNTTEKSLVYRILKNNPAVRCIFCSILSKTTSACATRSATRASKANGASPQLTTPSSFSNSRYKRYICFCCFSHRLPKTVINTGPLLPHQPTSHPIIFMNCEKVTFFHLIVI